MCNNCAGKVLSYILVFINVVLMLLGLLILGFSIYAAIDSPSAIRLLNENSTHFVDGKIGISFGRIFFWISVGFAIISSVAIIVSILGIVGALKGSKVVLLINFLLVLILLIGSIVGAFLLYFQNLDFLKLELENGLKNYKPARNTSESDDVFTATWDDLQIQFNCCGVNGAKDWVNITILPNVLYPDEKKRLVPPSCCSTITDLGIQRQCEFFPYDAKLEDRMGGCYDHFQKLIHTHKDTILIVMGSICGFFFLNLISVFMFSLCIDEEFIYTSVSRTMR